MSYSWGYIKDASLIKLDLPVDLAIQQGLLNKFVVYANEALTQICSAIKPKFAYTTFEVRDKRRVLEELTKIYLLKQPDEVKSTDMSFLYATNCQATFLTELQQSLRLEFLHYKYTRELIDMPEDFISFGGDEPIRIDGFSNRREASDEDFNYKGTKLIFFQDGDYIISYNARWFFFTPTTPESEPLDIPADIVDSIPSYIAAQCFKIDDEAKAAIMRNEFEVALSRIDNTHFEQNKTMKIAGGW